MKAVGKDEVGWRFGHYDSKPIMGVPSGPVDRSGERLRETVATFAVWCGTVVPFEAPGHARFMALALEAGRRALPRCLPNPPVGCVLVRQGKVVATGYTQEPGGPHAEAEALSRLSGDPGDVVAYVTLEPCSFHGRTPSCARTLAEIGIGEVHVAILDPDPRNDGQGTAILEKAGVKTTRGLLKDEAWRDLAPYLGRS